jgi:catabolite regulation protein CreA
MKEVGGDTNKRKGISCSQIGRINIGKIVTLSKVIFKYRQAKIDK